MRRDALVLESLCFANRGQTRLLLYGRMVLRERLELAFPEKGFPKDILRPRAGPGCVCRYNYPLVPIRLSCFLSSLHSFFLACSGCQQGESSSSIKGGLKALHRFLPDTRSAATDLWTNDSSSVSLPFPSCSWDTHTHKSAPRDCMPMEDNGIRR